MESDHAVVIVALLFVALLFVAALSVAIAAVGWRTIRKSPKLLSSREPAKSASEGAWSVVLGLFAVVGVGFGIWLATKRHA